MATKTPSKSPRQGKPPPKQASKLPIFAIVIGVVVVIGVIAVVASMGGKSKDDSATPANTAAAGFSETQPVTVDGPALPDMPSSPAAADPAVSKAPPTVNGKSFAGDPVVLTNDGKPKVVIFMAHWCPHCQREIPIIADYLKGHPSGDVVVYGVSTSVDKTRPNYPPSAWLDKIGWTQPTIADDAQGSAGAAYGLTSFPYFVAVTKDGTVAARQSGEIGTDQFAKLVSQAAGTA